MQRIVELSRNNPRGRKVALIVAILWILSKLYKKWKHSLRLFTQQKDIGNKTILITGCDTGFGNATALKLSIKLGYKVIATCLKKQSVEDFLCNTYYTKNGSTATVLDVTKLDNIERVKQFTIKYLHDTDSVLWGIVNNAGYSIPGNFEVVPLKMAEMERNVLYTAPLNIIRTFLPLLPGRKNFNSKTANKASVDGGRIVNVASAAARCIFGSDIRYGPSKAALSYFSHALRMEVLPRFGIYVSTIEPGGYTTNIVSGSKVWLKRVIDCVEEEKNSELLDIYELPDLDKFSKAIEYIEQGGLGYSPNIEQVVDCIIHGLTAKYPQRSYQPNWTFMIKFLVYAPLSVTEPVQLWLAQQVRKRMQ